MIRRRGNRPLQDIPQKITADPTRKVSHKPELRHEESKGGKRPTTGPRMPLNNLKSHSANERHDAPRMPSSPRSYLDRLPPEVLHMICEESSEDEMPALRLQCRYLYQVATPHFLRSVHVRFKKTSIESLLELSKHPILSRNVKMIMYEPNMVEKQPRSKWEESAGLIDLFHRTSDADLPSFPKQPASERDWRVFHRTLRDVIRQGALRYTRDELHFAWPIYQRYLQEQDVMINQNYACQDLLRAFQGFQNLSTIHINCGWGLWPDNPSSNPYQDGLCEAASHGPGDGDSDTALGLKETMPLLKMLSEADLNLLSLRIGSLSWRFLEGCENGGAHASFFEKMKHMVKSLEDFELVITTWTGIDSDDDDCHRREIDECREYLHNGVLGHLLAAASDLRRLAIAFDAHETSNALIEFKYYALDTHWPLLHTIELKSVYAYKDEWMRFFERHATTVKHLSLGMITLFKGDWLNILSRMQQILALEEVHFHHNLYGENPGQTWTLVPPGLTSREDDSIPANRLRWGLEEFLVRGGICTLVAQLD